VTAAVAAGAASRSHTTPPIDIFKIEAVQQTCTDCLTAEYSAALRVVKVQLEGTEVKVDVSSGVMRPLVPKPLREAVFTAVYNLAHPGVRATRRLIASRYLWPGLAKDVLSWCRACQQCQRAKASREPPTAVQPIPVPARFTHIHVDLVGPLPVSAEGYQYLFTVIDRSTRWAEALPLMVVATADCVDALISGWVARFGVPTLITSDCGVQFAPALWAALMKKLGVRHVMTTAYHPQSNGVLERFHRRLKEALRARAAATDWPLHLPWVLLGLRTAPREDSGVSTAQLVYGCALQLPGQLLAAEEQPPLIFSQQLNSGLPCVSPLPPPNDTAAVSQQLRAAEFVYIKAPPAALSLSPAFRGPYAVRKRSEKFYIVKIGQRYEAVS
jgi:cleavage and polyadenylation specificity factor subunit 1